MKALLIVLFALLVTGSHAQDTISTQADFNKWSIDGGIGLTKPYQMFSRGYRSATPDFFSGELGVRYMFNEFFGMRFGYGYNHFQAASNSSDFSSDFSRIDLQGVVNVGRLLKFEDWTKSINVLVHGGIGAGKLTFDQSPSDDYVGNAIAGITGQLKVSPRMSLNMDFTGLINVRQNLAFNGSRNPGDNKGYVFNGTIGFSYYLGKRNNHADWYIRGDKKYDVLSSRLTALEAAIQESERLNAEGAEKSRKEFEGLQGQIGDINQKISQPSDNYNDFVTKLINDGFVNVFFDFNSTKIDKVSAGAVDFLITYLNNNPSRNVSLLGYADERGSEKYNLQLSENRAKALVDLLVEAGINSSRLQGQGKGEAKLTQSEKSSAQAYQLSRRVSVEVR
jgi:OOP family OmpA-OmpF porin